MMVLLATRVMLRTVIDRNRLNWITHVLSSTAMAVALATPATGAAPGYETSVANLYSGDLVTRAFAVTRLSQERDHASSAIPVLLSISGDPTVFKMGVFTSVGEEAIRTIVDYGDAARDLLEKILVCKPPCPLTAKVEIHIPEKGTWGTAKVPYRGRSTYIRLGVIEALGRLTDTKAVESLLGLLKSRDQAMVDHVASSLARIGDRRAVMPLLERLAAAQRPSRRVLESLGRLHDPRAVEPLVRLLDNPDYYVRLASAEALAEIGDVRALDPLQNALKKSETEHEWKDMYPLVVKALENMASRAAVPELVSILQGEYASIAADALQHAPLSEKREPLLALLASNRAQLGVVGRALASADDPGLIDKALESLHDPDVKLRSDAVEIIARSHSPERARVLRDVLKDPAERVRRAALDWSLARKDDDTVTFMIAALQDREPTVRCWAATALGNIGDPRAIAPLIAALSDNDARGRREAALALSKLKAADAVSPLIALLASEKEEHVRANAAIALGEIGDKRALDVLVGCLGDTYDWARYQCALAIGKLHDPRGVDALLATKIEDGTASAVAQALGEAGDERAVGHLVHLLSNPDNSRARQQAALALGKMRVGGAVVNLVPLLEDKSIDVRRAAVEALCRIGGPQAVQPLLAILDSRDAHKKLWLIDVLQELTKKDFGLNLAKWRGMLEKADPGPVVF